MKESGLVAGLFLIFAVALLTDKSLRLLIETGKHANVQSYETLLEAAFGRTGFVFISLNMLIMSYGAMIAYLLVLKDTFPSVLGVDDDDERGKRIVLVVSSLVVILPLSMQRDMADLAKTSSFSVMFDMCMVVIIAVCSPVRESVLERGGIEQLLREDMVRPSTLFVGLGVLSFAFVCQDSSFIIAGSMHRPTKERWGAVTRSSLMTCATLSTIIGVTGYLGFQGATDGNILNNFTNIPPGAMLFDLVPLQQAVNVARGFLGLTMFCVYPLASYVARHVLIVLLFSGRQAHEGDDHTVLARKDRRIVLTVALYISAIVPAILYEDVGTVLAITGAVGGSCLSYLGPGAVFLGIHGKEFLDMVRWNVSTTVQGCMWKYPAAVNKVDARFRPENSPDQNMGVVAQCVCLLAWYFLLMPLWCSVASAGASNYEKFEEEQIRKSPAVQRRLGKTKHRKRGANGGRAAERERVRSASFDDSSSGNLAQSAERYPLLAKPMLPPLSSQPGPNSDVAYGTTSDIANEGDVGVANAADSSVDEFLEDDPQDVSPSWTDFLLAISYMILGVVAFFAGLVSIG